VGEMFVVRIGNIRKTIFLQAILHLTAWEKRQDATKARHKPYCSRAGLARIDALKGIKMPKLEHRTL
jgi:hypothetical protein